MKHRDDARPAWALLFLGLIGAPAAGAQDVIVKPQPRPGVDDGSSLLVKPGAGSDRYGPKVDWRDVPPWRQAAFFGVRTQARVVVYVVDCSGSMGDADRLVRAKLELRKSIQALQFPQRFHVIFYNDRPLAMPGGPSQPADARSKAQFFNWLRLIPPDGGTDPRAALRQALGLRPDAIFLLSDGEFPEGTAEAIGSANPAKVPIHCIDLAGGAAGDDLKRIARDSGGEYAARP